MPRQVQRDPFARGGYDRKCHGPGECDWCGQHRQRRFSYRWDPDDSRRAPDHTYSRRFCNFACFSSFHS